MRALVLMGSGETSPTMVKVHRSTFSPPGVLLDTPFGFQSNADELTARAQHYFAESVGRALDVASFRSIDDIGSAAYESSMSLLRGARFVFAGPGSPTYALRVWQASAVPSLLGEKLAVGGDGVVTFASAAALTVGGWTVPVYEIYKVGEDPSWAPGLGLLEVAVGWRAAVIPHFNNAEGGTHDTRYCYLGESRLRELEAALPDDAFVLGIDEHTGLVLDLDAGSASVVGVGGVTIRWRSGGSRVIGGDSVVAIESLASDGASAVASVAPVASASRGASAASPLVDEAAKLQMAFDDALSAADTAGAVQAALDVETLLREWADETFSENEYERARAALRGMLATLGTAAQRGVADPADVVRPFVDALVEARTLARAARRYDEADLLRDRLLAAGVEIHDSPSGTTWSLR